MGGGGGWARGRRARCRVGAGTGSLSAARAIGLALIASGCVTRFAETWAVAPLAVRGGCGPRWQRAGQPWVMAT